MNYVKPLANGPYTNVDLCIKDSQISSSWSCALELEGLDVCMYGGGEESIYSYDQMQSFVLENEIDISSISKKARIVEFFSRCSDDPEILTYLKEYTSKDKHYTLDVVEQAPNGTLTKVRRKNIVSGIYLVHEKDSTRIVHLSKESLLRTYNRVDQLTGNCPITHYPITFHEVGEITDIEKIGKYTDRHVLMDTIKRTLPTIPSDMTMTGPIEDLKFDHNFTIAQDMHVKITGAYTLFRDIKNNRQLMKLSSIDIAISTGGIVIKQPSNKCSDKTK